MKLRLHKHAVRLRLDEADLQHLTRSGRVEGETAFAPDVALRYALEVSDLEDFSVRSEPSGFTILIPDESVRAWTGSDQVGFSFTYPGSKSAPVAYTVEKDLGCRHGGG